MIYTSIWPHENRVDVTMEIFNEVILILSTYNVMLLTDKQIDIEVRFHLGTTMIALLSIITLTNIGVTTTTTFQRYLLFRKYKQLRKLKIEMKAKEDSEAKANKPDDATETTEIKAKLAKELTV